MLGTWTRSRARQDRSSQLKCSHSSYSSFRQAVSTTLQGQRLPLLVTSRKARMHTSTQRPLFGMSARVRAQPAVAGMPIGPICVTGRWFHRSHERTIRRVRVFSAPARRDGRNWPRRPGSRSKYINRYQAEAYADQDRRAADRLVALARTSRSAVPYTATRRSTGSAMTIGSGSGGRPEASVR
jgi:hypothetical protein